MNVPVFGNDIPFHCRIDDLNVTAAAAQQIAKRSFKVIYANRIAAGRGDLNNAKRIV